MTSDGTDETGRRPATARGTEPGGPAHLRGPRHLRAPRRRHRSHVQGRATRRGTVALAVLALAAVGASAAAGAALTEPSPAPVEQQLADEVDGMIDAGLPPDHPKVEMVEEMLASLEESRAAPGPSEPGVDVAALLADAESEGAQRDEAERRADAGAGARAADPRAAGWESGTVLCEPVPGLLTVDELAGARCLSVPQPDGTARYVALSPDGVVRSVRFGNDGDVRRLPDTRLLGPAAAGTALAPTPEGDLRVTPPAGRATTVDLP
jgi:hypothetical protein